MVLFISWTSHFLFGTRRFEFRGGAIDHFVGTFLSLLPSFSVLFHSSQCVATIVAAYYRSIYNLVLFDQRARNGNSIASGPMDTVESRAACSSRGTSPNSNSLSLPGTIRKHPKHHTEKNKLNNIKREEKKGETEENNLFLPYYYYYYYPPSWREKTIWTTTTTNNNVKSGE